MLKKINIGDKYILETNKVKLSNNIKINENGRK